jgi:hypothetical protein
MMEHDRLISDYVNAHLQEAIELYEHSVSPYAAVYIIRKLLGRLCQRINEFTIVE